eukprot:5373010-Prymnesium_polylepis.1
MLSVALSRNREQACSKRRPVRGEVSLPEVRPVWVVKPGRRLCRGILDRRIRTKATGDEGHGGIEDVQLLVVLRPPPLDLFEQGCRFLWRPCRFLCQCQTPHTKPGWRSYVHASRSSLTRLTAIQPALSPRQICASS